MRNGLKAALAAGAIAALGAAGFAQQSIAYDKHRGHGYHGGYGKHDSSNRHHRSYRGHGFNRMMERFDKDGNQELTQDELNAARQDLLAKHDGDTDGKLTLEEFQMLWLEFMRKKMVRSFQHLDADGDAVISADEFVEPFSEAVRHMDRNGDGVLNSDDRRHGHNKSDDDKSDDDKSEQEN
jgi:hypothetical protein